MSPGRRTRAVALALVFSCAVAALCVSAGVEAKQKPPPVEAVTVGDFDGDGTPDVAVGVPGVKAGKLKEAGEVRLYSGKTGKCIGKFPGTQKEESLGGSVVAIGDQDGDGATDLAIGSPWRSSAIIYIVSGKSLERIDYIPGGAARALGEEVAAIGDGSGTSKVNLLIRDGITRKRYYMMPPDGGLGRSLDEGEPLISQVSWVGDLLGDGHPDFVIGDWSAAADGQKLAGRVRAFSGKRMSPFGRGEGEPLLWTVEGTEEGECLGLFSTPAGDWNDDGKGDVLTTSSGNGDDKESSWRLRVLSGVDGAVLWDHRGEPGDLSVSEAVVLPDLNDDDKPEVALGHPGRNKKSGVVEVISGADGAVIWTIEGARGEMLGEELRRCADVDGDELPDLVVVSPGAKNKGKKGNGYIRILSSKDGSTITLINPLRTK